MLLAWLSVEVVAGIDARDCWGWLFLRRWLMAVVGTADVGWRRRDGCRCLAVMLSLATVATAVASRDVVVVLYRMCRLACQYA